MGQNRRIWLIRRVGRVDRASSCGLDLAGYSRVW